VPTPSIASLFLQGLQSQILLVEFGDPPFIPGVGLKVQFTTHLAEMDQFFYDIVHGSHQSNLDPA
jgi:hypothetical protein